MKSIIILLTGMLTLLASCGQSNNNPFDNYFTNNTLRIDYFHSGNATSEELEIDQIYSYESWSGSKVTLLDPLDYGTYYYKIYDKESGALIYSRGFDSYFKEYQLTTVAIEGAVKQYHESAIIPFPKASIVFSFEKRDKTGKMKEVYRTEINPSSANKGPYDDDVRVYTSLNSGDPSIIADVLIVGEGYKAKEDQKFQDDLNRFTEIFFKAEPCKSYKNRFNIRGVLKPSTDSGVDEPNITALNDAENIKWKHLVSEGIKIPTEWDKALYDSQDLAWQIRRAQMNKNISQLKRDGATEESIHAATENYNAESTKRDQEVHTFLELNELSGKVGAFEGAGYASTGLYRPCLNCIMFSRADYFCPVCQDAMIKVIESYCE